MKKANMIRMAIALLLIPGIGSLVTAIGLEAGTSGQMQSAMPGPVHSRLARRAGEYTTVTRFTAQPGAKPVDSNGTAKFSVILDGRFLLEEDAGIFMGQETKGTRLWGYDNGTSEYVSVWAYTGATGLMNLTGRSKDDGKTVNFVATFNDDGGAKQVFDVAVQELDGNRFVVGLYAKNPDGSRGAAFETTFTRKSK
jgi:hypothetical protein